MTNRKKRDPLKAEVGVGTFEWNGHTITNPFQDETARFPVTPAHYGFEITNTGGGCTAWVRDEAPGVELWVSGLDSDAATCDCRGWIIGLYYTAENLGDVAMGNDEMEPIWCVTVPVGGERKIDISDPDPRPHLDRQDDVVWLQLCSTQTIVPHKELGEWFGAVMGDNASVSQDYLAGPADDPSFRLLAGVMFGDTNFHAEAIRVASDDGEQVPDTRTGADYDGYDGILDEWRSIDPGYWQTMSYFPFPGDTDTAIEYVVLIHPHVE